MLGEYTNKKMAAASSCQLQNNTMIQTRCYPSSLLCIGLWFSTTTMHTVYINNMTTVAIAINYVPLQRSLAFSLTPRLEPVHAAETTTKFSLLPSATKLRRLCFTPVCQSFCSVHWGGLPQCMLGYHHLHPGPGRHPLGADPRADNPPADPPGADPPWAGPLPRFHPPGRQLPLRTVRILLECILVFDVVMEWVLYPIVTATPTDKSGSHGNKWRCSYRSDNGTEIYF